MPAKTKRGRKIEAVKAWMSAEPETLIVNPDKHWVDDVPVRIIREADWRRVMAERRLLGAYRRYDLGFGERDEVPKLESAFQRRFGMGRK